MKTETHHFVIGTNPYENTNEFYTKGNGSPLGWSLPALDLDSALRGIFSSMLFPCEATGRRGGKFIPGISLPLPASEVIQVWSTDPDCLKRAGQIAADPNLAELLGKGGVIMAHNGRGEGYGLLCEIDVREVSRFLLAPALAALPAPGDDVALSPIGVQLSGFVMARITAQTEIATMQSRALISQRQARTLEDQIRAQQRALESQLEQARLYLSGVSDVAYIAHGDRAPAAGMPYSIFQYRTFVDVEFGVLADFNFRDFSSLEQLDQWLLSSGRWKKLLPFEKTIMVSRITRNERDYGNAFENAFKNAMNASHVVWIRDGETLIRLGCEMEFTDAVVPRGEEYDTIARSLQESVWSHFSAIERNDKDNVSGLVKKAEEQSKPYRLKIDYPPAFDSLEDWLKSEFYTEGIDDQIRKSATSFVSSRARQQFKFLVWLQGVVDNHAYLNVPKGTDLGSDDNFNRFFKTVRDSEVMISWPEDRLAFDALCADVKKGDRIFIERVEFEISGKWHKRQNFPAEVSGRSEKGALIVKARLPKARGYGLKSAPEALTLNKDTDFIPFAITPELIAKLLDDRGWKLDHTWHAKTLSRLSQGLLDSSEE